MSSITYVSLVLLVTFFQKSAGSCVRDDISYWGADLQRVKANDIDECTRACRAFERCKAVTYIKSQKKCYLKHRRGGNRGPMYLKGRISVNMECDNKKDHSCIERGINFIAYGGEIARRTVNTFDLCEQFCRDTEGCHSITYETSSRKCWLRNKRGHSWAEASVRTWGRMRAEGKTSLNMQC